MTPRDSRSNPVKTQRDPAMSPVLKVLQRPHLPQSKGQVLPPLKPRLWYRALLHSLMTVLATLLFLPHARLNLPRGLSQSLSLLIGGLSLRCE